MQGVTAVSSSSVAMRTTKLSVCHLKVKERLALQYVGAACTYVLTARKQLDQQRLKLKDRSIVQHNDIKIVCSRATSWSACVS